MSYNTKTWCLALLGALAAAGGGGARVSAIDLRQGPPSLFADAPPRAAAERGLERDRTEIRARLVIVDFAALRDERAVEPAAHARPALVLNLFEDAVFTAVLDRVDVAAGGFTWVGHIAGVELSNVTLATVDGVMAGSVVTPAAAYSIRYRRPGLHEIRQVDQSQFPPELDPIRVSPGGQEDVPAFGEPGVSGDDGSTIDVMVLYTPAAASAAGGTSAMTTLINLGVSETNTSYSNSGIVQRLRLVHAEQVPYTEDLAGGLNRDLVNLRNGYGALAGVGALRDTYGADIVTLLANNTGSAGTCGIGYLMTSASTTFAPYAFNVVQQTCVSPNFSFAHELGHNMGAMHDWFMDNGVQPYTYAHGYVSATDRWRTVMAYNDVCKAQGFNCTRLLYWSNPDVSYGGIPMGIAGGTNSSCPSGDVSNVSCDADDHRALNNTAPTVANFRQTVLTAALSASPTSLRFTATKAGAAGDLVTVTAAQTITVSVTGASTGWTASADQSWVQLTNASGFNAGQFTVSIINPGNVLNGSTNVTSTITITPTTTGLAATTATVMLTIDLTAGASAPFGQIDAPAQNATGVQGAIGMTGWALDDVGVAGVKIYRNCLAFENQANCQLIAGNSVVYVGDATFVAGARPDVEAAFPDYPQASRAGWGYLLLTNALPHVPNQLLYGGQGTLNLYAFATDAEGHLTLLGRNWNAAGGPTTITLANDTIAKPFGAVDTPGQGATVSGTCATFGWALTPDSDTVAEASDILIPTNGSTMVVFIDGVAMAHVAYNQCRGSVGNPVPAWEYCNDDVASIFGNMTPQPPFTIRTANPTRYRNLDAGRAAIGALNIDTTTFTNGMHSIAWSVTDSAGRVDGIGSRYFTVLNTGRDVSTDALAGVAQLQRAPAITRGSAKKVARLRPAAGPAWARSGFDLRTSYRAIPPDRQGVRQVWIPELGRLELYLGPVDIGYLVANGTQRDLPAGSHLDTTTGLFTWMPGPAYVGSYRLTFVRGSEQVVVDVSVGPPSRSAPQRPDAGRPRRDRSMRPRG
jgi:hypothetical protein